MSTSTTDWIIDTRRRIILDAEQDGDGSMTVREQRDRLVAAYVEDVKAGRLSRRAQPSVEEEAEEYVALHLPPLRQTSKSERKEALRIAAEYGQSILNARVEMDDGTTQPLRDPILDLILPLGTGDGQDKRFGKWTVRDLERHTLEGYRQAADQTRAAQEEDAQNQVTIDAMHMVEAVYVEDLFK